MRVLVTGGAGFIGANLCRRLRSTEGIDAVVALDDLSTGFRSNLADIDIELIEGSFLDRDVVDRAAHGCDAIVHLGARPSVPRSVADPVASHVANASGTVEVLEAARRLDAQVVVASSSSVYGSNPAIPKHEDLATRPRSPYAASKLAAEGYTLAYGATYGLPVVAFRFFNVFGPLQAAGHAYAAVVPAFLSAALAGAPLDVHGDGTQSRDFTFVDTVTDVLAQAVTRRASSDEPVNLAFGTRTTLLELIEHIEAQLGHGVQRRHTERRAGDVDHSQAANDRLRALFPDVVPTSLADGLAATLDWFRSDPHQS